MSKRKSKLAMFLRGGKWVKPGKKRYSRLDKGKPAHKISPTGIDNNIEDKEVNEKKQYAKIFRGILIDLDLSTMERSDCTHVFDRAQLQVQKRLILGHSFAPFKTHSDILKQFRLQGIEFQQELKKMQRSSENIRPTKKHSNAYRNKKKIQKKPNEIAIIDAQFERTIALIHDLHKVDPKEIEELRQRYQNTHAHNRKRILKRVKLLNTILPMRNALRK